MKGTTWYYKHDNSVPGSASFVRPVSKVPVLDPEMPWYRPSRPSSAPANKSVIRRLGTPTQAR